MEVDFGGAAILHFAGFEMCAWGMGGVRFC
jgi:hypothetical protein